MELTALPIGKSAIIAGLKAKGLMRRRLLDLGLVPATTIEAVRRSPAGDPVAYRVRGTSYRPASRGKPFNYRTTVTVARLTPFERNRPAQTGEKAWI